MSESLARTSAGIRLYACPNLPATQTAANFRALSWDEIGEVTNVGEFGKAYQLITHEPLGDRKTFKRKGNYNQGTVALQVARIETDTGQGRCQTSRDTDTNISFKVRYDESKDENGNLLYMITYDGGTAEFSVGETVTGGTSTATAEIVGITVEVEASGGGDGEGVLYVIDVTGTFGPDGEALTGNGTPSGAADFVSIAKGYDEADYFVGTVLSYTTNIGTGNQILGASCNIEIDGDIIEEAATAVPEGE